MVERVKFTKSYLEALKSQEKTTRSYHYDASILGLCILTTPKGTQTFYVYKKINGKPSRIKIGRFPDLSIENARKKAQQVLAQVALGENPNKLKREQQARQKNLSDVFNDYLAARQNLKPSTIQDYHRIMRENFPDWQKLSILEITKEQISKRHVDIGKRSHARANLAMRLLRALFNFASGQYEDAHGKALITENPVKQLSHAKSWYRVSRKTSFIKSSDLPRWFSATNQIPLLLRSSSNAEVVRDYLLLILFTGLRRSEAANLKWDDVDLLNKTIQISETKNHKVHILPLSSFIEEILIRRKDHAQGSLVFPGATPEKPIMEPRKIMFKITEVSGVSFTIHDLRRTFITIAESLDISLYALKYLLNHDMGHDVTRGYIIMNAERVREPMQRITNTILEQCKAPN